jgi:hypothetical protein
MKKLFFIISIFLLGCGYTTTAFIGGGRIYIKPIVNEIAVTKEERAYSEYRTYPILLEKKLTNKLIDEFNTKTRFEVTPDFTNSNRLECRIVDFRREALRYDDADEVTEKRLRLYVTLRYYDSENNLLKDKEIIGETTYRLTGSYKKSESEAQDVLLEDTARRIVEAIAEDW